MNIVPSILNSPTDEELKAMVAELRTMETTAVMPQGLIRRLEQQIQAAVPGISANDARALIRGGVYRVAALRWAGLPPLGN